MNKAVDVYKRQVQDLLDHFRVQSGGGLVKEHDLRLHGQSADDGDTLLLAAGEHVGAVSYTHLDVYKRQS